MLVLITKDEHNQLGFRNKFRKPGWENDLKYKHDFIIKYMKDHDIKYKITTGDILDNQKHWTFKQYSLNKNLLKKYQNNGLKIITPAGNHDMLEGRIDIQDSPFEDLVKSKIINHVNFSSFFMKDEKEEVEVIGFDYRNILSKDDKEKFLDDCKKYLESCKKDAKKIIIMHQNITPDKTRVTEFTYDELSELANDYNVDCIICGHYHLGYKSVMHNNVLFINPWNFWRVVRDYHTREDEHMPEFVVLDTKTMKTIHVEIPHKKYTEAFDIKEIEAFKSIKQEIFDFFEKVSFDTIEDEDDDSNLLLKFKKEIMEQHDLTENELNIIFNEIQNKI